MIKNLHKKTKKKGVQDFQILLKYAYKNTKSYINDNKLARMHKLFEKEIRIEQIKDMVEDFSCRNLYKENSQIVKDLYKLINDILIHYSLKLKMVVNLEDITKLLPGKKKIIYKKMKMRDSLSIINNYNGDISNLIKTIMTTFKENQSIQDKVVKAATKHSKEKLQKTTSRDEHCVIGTDDTIETNVNNIERFHAILFTVNGGVIDLKFTEIFTNDFFNKILIVLYEYNKAIFNRNEITTIKSDHSHADMLNDFLNYMSYSSNINKNPRELLKLIEKYIVPDFGEINKYGLLNKNVSNFLHYLSQKYDNLQKKSLLCESIINSDWYPQLLKLSSTSNNIQTSVDDLAQYIKTAYTKDRLNIFNSNLNSLKSCDESEYCRFKNIHDIIQSLLHIQPNIETVTRSANKTRFETLIDKISNILISMTNNIFCERNLEEKKACYCFLNDLKQELKNVHSRHEYIVKEKKFVEISNFIDLLSAIDNKTITTDIFISTMKNISQFPNNPEYVKLLVEKAKKTETIINFIINIQTHVNLLNEFTFSEKLFHKLIQDPIDVSQVSLEARKDK